MLALFMGAMMALGGSAAGRAAVSFMGTAVVVTPFIEARYRKRYAEMGFLPGDDLRQLRQVVPEAAAKKFHPDILALLGRESLVILPREYAFLVWAHELVGDQRAFQKLEPAIRRLANFSRLRK
jgi:hypothetical protein